MKVGPLEYIVIGVPDRKFTHALINELKSIHSKGAISVVDMIFISKDTGGEVSVQEISELSKNEPEVYSEISKDLMGLMTLQDIEQLTQQVSPGTAAVVIIFEHTWVKGLAGHIKNGGGAVLSGGMIQEDIMKTLNEELAAVKEVEQNA